MSDLIHIKEVSSVSSYELAPGYATVNKQIHDGWELFYLNSGTVEYKTERGSGTLRQGELLFHPPGEVHETVCGKRRGASIFTVIFESKSRAMDYFSGRTVKLPTGLRSHLRRIADECMKTYVVSEYPLCTRADAPRGGDQAVRCLLEVFLIMLMREEPFVQASAADSLPGRDDGLIDGICRYIESRMCTSITVEELCRHFSFGKTYLYSFFKGHTGMTMLEYHTEVRISEAKRLLRESTLSVREISEQLGYDTPEYFTRCFSKRAGCSPREFRAMLITASGGKLQ